MVKKIAKKEEEIKKEDIKEDAIKEDAVKEETNDYDLDEEEIKNSEVNKKEIKEDEADQEEIKEDVFNNDDFLKDDFLNDEMNANDNKEEVKQDIKKGMQGKRHNRTLLIIIFILSSLILLLMLSRIHEPRLFGEINDDIIPPLEGLPEPPDNTSDVLQVSNDEEGLKDVSEVLLELSDEFSDINPEDIENVVKGVNPDSLYISPLKANVIQSDFVYACERISEPSLEVECLELYYVNNIEELGDMKSSCLPGDTRCLDEYYLRSSVYGGSSFCVMIESPELLEGCYDGQ